MNNNYKVGDKIKVRISDDNDSWNGQLLTGIKAMINNKIGTIERIYNSTGFYEVVVRFNFKLLSPYENGICLLEDEIQPVDNQLTFDFMN